MGPKRNVACGIRQREKRQRSALRGGAREAGRCDALPNGPCDHAGQKDAEIPGVVRANMGDKAPNRPPKMRKPEVLEGVKVTSRRAKVCDEVEELKHAGSNICCAYRGQGAWRSTGMSSPR